MGNVSLVIGATGKVGGYLVKQLVDEARPVKAASRSGTAPTGAEGINFDWFDPTSHDAALSDVDRVFMVAPIGASDPIESMAPFIDRAVERGVKRFVLLSSSLIEEGGPAMGAVHAFLRQRAPEWAVLRPSWFMENFTIDPHLSSIRFDDAVYSATASGAVPFIACADIAEVGLRTLTDGAPLNDGVILTGPSLLTYADVGKVIGSARGRPVRHENLSADALSARLSGFGIPAQFAAMLAGMDTAIAAGAEARTTPLVAEITGREPTSFEHFASPRGELWRAPVG